MNTTVTQLRKTIESILSAHPIYGARHTAEQVARDLSSDFGSRVIDVGLSWDRAWGVGASLRIFVEREKVMKGVYGGSVPCVRFRVSSDIGWSSSGWSVNSATAAVALYRQVIDLAALIQTATDGLEEEVEVVKEPGITEVSK